MKQLSFVFFAALVGIIILAYWLNRVAINLAVSETFYALMAGLKILFFVGLALGIAWAIIELKRHAQVKVIRPGKHGPAQAVIQRGEVVQLQGPNQLDPMQQLAMLKTFVQLQGQMQRLAVNPQTTVQEVAPKELAAPKEAIPAVVKYADVAPEVPTGMSLLGIHPSSGQLELADYEKLKMLWIIGSSSTGKSNTVYGKALEATLNGAKLAVIDQHAVKTDSLARKLAPLSGAFIRPIATDEAQTVSMLQWFKQEFESRVRGASCDQKIVLIADEMNRMVRSENQDQVRLLKEVVAIGGEESRGFGMYVWCLSQKAAHMKWLRDSAITVIAHRLTRFEEALLACNEDRNAARRLLEFPVGRTYLYGVDFDTPLELQQPLYEAPKSTGIVESTIEAVEASSTQKTWSDNSTDGRLANAATEPMDATLPFDVEKFKQAQKKLLAGDNQNAIICDVWGVQENTRAFRAAKEEFRVMLQYLASLAGE